MLSTLPCNLHRPGLESELAYVCLRQYPSQHILPMGSAVVTGRPLYGAKEIAHAGMDSYDAFKMVMPLQARSNPSPFWSGLSCLDSFTLIGRPCLRSPYQQQ